MFEMSRVNIACILGTIAISICAVQLFKHMPLKSEPALYFSIYDAYMILFKSFLKTQDQ